MKPLDSRLLRHARAARRYIAFTAATGFATAALVVAQALLIAHAVSPVIEGRAGWDQVAHLVGWLAAVVAARVVVLVAQESFAHRAAGDVIAELRAQVLARAVEQGPRWLASGHGAQVVTLATRGLDDLEPYFVRYLPQLLLAATVTPASLVVVFGLDLVSALIITLTIPLIPVFMWLIGVLTATFAAEKLEVMQRLGAQLLDLLAGLSTLKALGREQGPGKRVGDLGRAYTRTTMSTLRVAFLSGAVLEFLASISIALVAVVIGTRLVAGDLDLTTGLAVLMLAPEIYKPIRDVGSQFHASADGVAAAEQAFGILELPLPAAGTSPAPDLRRTDIVLDGVSVAAPGRATWAPAGLSARLRPGRVIALVGPSGAGKTTAAAVVLGLLRPDAGTVRLVPDGAGRAAGAASAGRADGPDGTGRAGRAVPAAPAGVLDLADVEPESWRRQVAWVPQRPVILPGTVRENVLGGAGDATAASGSTGRAIGARAAAAARATGLDAVVASLPEGWDTVLGHGGVGLSVGQRQRLALTRALLGEETLVVLDEPTAHLDAAAERHVLDAVAQLRDQGRTVLVIAHRAALVALADDVVTLRSRPADGAGADRSETRPGAAGAAARAEEVTP
ncbi:thiol reductant ABC exporter subunit CydD [Georgenia sp. SYP-B2076]|uniref:thiol reductant ABC exporter subunit CydD n=1 Tax=Georgenia sp. SYP-B2076 TaxID=2495881 RepID=UPI000F8F4F8F|nr:thiol reductant ABC exporter subunit CydD [Georgenia sp. SYP-B2076]